jgi:hypothetical protein
VLNHEKDSIAVISASIEQLAHFKRKIFILWSQAATGWKFAQRFDRLLHATEPTQARPFRLHAVNVTM